MNVIRIETTGSTRTWAMNEMVHYAERFAVTIDWSDSHQAVITGESEALLGEFAVLYGIILAGYGDDEE